MDNAKITTHSAAQRRQYYASGFWRNKTIFQIVQEHAERAPDRFAVRDRYRRLTYQQLVSAAERLADDFSGNGIETGQLVAVWLSNRLETVVTLLACSRNRYICCPSLHRNHTITEVMKLLERLRAVALITEKGYGVGAERCDIGAKLARLTPAPGHYGLQPFDGENAAAPLFDHLLAATLPDAAVAGPAVADPDAVVYLALTSGTTAEPKGVMHSDNTLLANARAIAADWHFNAASIIYTLSPLSHNLGFGAMVTALYAGGELVLSGLNTGESLVNDLCRTGATFIYGVPTHAVDLLKELRHAGVRAPASITGFRVSGAQAPAEVVAELLEYGIMPQTGYGMTEAHSHNYTLPDDDPWRIIGTAGRAAPGYEIKIWSLENADLEVATAEVGQVGGRGASLMLGYSDDEAATANSFNSHGWFMTGDLGSLDEDGYLHIKGRSKEVIIRGGHNIYPARIEQLAVCHPAVEKAAAIPFPDERLGERVCLVIVPVAEVHPDPEQIVAYLEAQGLSKYDLPECFAEVDNMPVNPSGKVLKRELLTLIDSGRLHPLRLRR